VALIDGAGRQALRLAEERADECPCEQRVLTLAEDVLRRLLDAHEMNREVLAGPGGGTLLPREPARA
jgi:hypothetical protein